MSVTKLTCAERDAILYAEGRYEGWSVHSSLTDLSGEFGEPRIETTWEKGGRLINDVRHPGPDGVDVAPCEHYDLGSDEKSEGQ